MEDDVKFIDGFYDIFNEKISSLPDDWDFLYLGGICWFGGKGLQLITGNKKFTPTNENYKSLNYELCKTHWTQCAHALAINSKFYSVLLEEYTKNKINAIDTIHCMLQRDGFCNAYVFLPSLAMQRSSFSDIENNFVDYESKF